MTEPGFQGVLRSGFCIAFFAVWMREMIRITKLQPVATIVAEATQARIQRVEFVEVEAGQENPVLEAVHPWLKSMVHHPSLIEAGAERGIVVEGAVGHASERDRRINGSNVEAVKRASAPRQLTGDGRSKPPTRKDKPSVAPALVPV
jgi:hypothetical protein